MTYTFEVKDEDGNVVFRADKPDLDMLEEEIGRWERNNKEKDNV